MSTLPANTSIETLFIGPGFGSRPSADTTDLFKSICLGNQTIKNLTICDDPEFDEYLETDEKKQEWENALRQNHSLESIEVGRHPISSFQPILQLNKAGRRYLAEDATSCSKCIAVMAKVKEELDCLYLHMRENPILCMNSDRDAAAQVSSDKKQKAEDVGG